MPLGLVWIPRAIKLMGNCPMRGVSGQLDRFGMSPHIHTRTHSNTSTHTRTLTHTFQQSQVHAIPLGLI